jgi:hypothetical protein
MKALDLRTGGFSPLSPFIKHESPPSSDRGLFLYVRVSSKHLKQATSYHQNNARGLLGNISSLLLNAISPTDPFLNIRGGKNHAFKSNSLSTNNVRA